MPQPPDDIDAVVVRTWCSLALEALGRDREEIDAINVYPVADGDTGTNLYLTVESAAQAVEAVFVAHGTVGAAGPDAGTTDGAPGGESAPALADAVRAMAHGALIGARGNSGTILAQLLRGMAEVLGAPAGDDDHAELLSEALRRAAESAYQAVAHPVEGTVLTVATAAAEAAAAAAARTGTSAAAGTGAGCTAVARAAYKGACAALDATPDSWPYSAARASWTRAAGAWSTCSPRWPGRSPVRLRPPSGGGLPPSCPRTSPTTARPKAARPSR